MLFNPENKINRLCAEGIALEGEDLAKAGELYLQAWNEAQTNSEKATAAHYLARVQTGAPDQLDWNLKALEHGLCSEEETVKNALLPSLYLNAGKSLEDTGKSDQAKIHFTAGLHYVELLAPDGYVSFVKNALIKRIADIS